MKSGALQPPVRWFVAGDGKWSEWLVTDEDAVDRSYVDELEHFIVAEASRESQLTGRMVPPGQRPNAFPELYCRHVPVRLEFTPT